LFSAGNTNGHKRSQTVTNFLTAIFYGKPNGHNGHNGHKFFIIKVGGLYPFNKKICDRCDRCDRWVFHRKWRLRNLWPFVTVGVSSRKQWRFIRLRPFMMLYDGFMTVFWPFFDRFVTVVVTVVTVVTVVWPFMTGFGRLWRSVTVRDRCMAVYDCLWPLLTVSDHCMAVYDCFWPFVTVCYCFVTVPWGFRTVCNRPGTRRSTSPGLTE